MKSGETWGDCAIRGVDEELGAKVRVVSESYTSFVEEKRSLSAGRAGTLPHGAMDLAASAWA